MACYKKIKKEILKESEVTMGIARITYLFDIKKFREDFEPITQLLELNDINVLREKAQNLASRNLVSWKLLDQLGYLPDDFGKEEEEFEDIRSRVRFWILTHISSFCKTTENKPLDSRSIAILLKKLNFEDDETIRKLQWGRPLGALLLPKMVLRPALDRDDSKWPYWCQSYGSLGWLLESDINTFLGLFTKRLNEENNLDDEKQLEVLLNTLEEAHEKNQGFLLGESA